MQTTVSMTHVRVEMAKDFAQVTEALERQLGRFDGGILRSLPANPDEARHLIEKMAGPSGFMLFGTIDHGALLTLAGQKRGRCSTSSAIRCSPFR